MVSDFTEKQFIEMLKQGQKVFNRICVEEGTLKGFDLSYLIFEECVFCIDFSGSNFDNTKFINSNLKTCIFSNCILTNAVFTGNSLDATKFSGAKVEGITFKNNTFHSIVLTYSHLSEMIL